GAAREFGAVAVDQVLQPLDGGAGQVAQLLRRLGEALLDLRLLLAAALEVVGGDAADAQLEQALHVLVVHRAYEEARVLLHPGDDALAHGVLGLGVLEAAVDALLDEDPLEREPVLAVDELALLPLELRLDALAELLGERLQH